MNARASRSTSPVSAGQTEKPPRQRPGLACLNCRSKKLKCDGEQPQCGNCLIAGIKCVVPSTSSKRGPQKGHLKALQSRLATLEQRVLERDGADQPTTMPPSSSSSAASSSCSLAGVTSAAPPPTSLPVSSAATTACAFSTSFPDHMETSPLSDEFLFNPELCFSDQAILQMPTTGPFPLATPPRSSGMTPEPKADPYNNPFFHFGPPSDIFANPSANFVISDLLRTDLEQLYFDRTHRFVPILCQRRYFSWARSSNKTEAQICLQYAIWTSAASLSSHLQSVRESLYATATRLLSQLEAKDGIKPCVEHVQARILILIYDFMRSSHNRGWMSAGQCFRLIQLMRLFETDATGPIGRSDSADGVVDWITVEEQRRAFWMAFCLDIFISIRQEWPLTLHDHIKSTRLPMPEENFQNGEYVEMGYLSDDLSTMDNISFSPFNESIICAAIYMRSILHRQQAMFGGIDPDLTAFWHRHDKVDAAIRLRSDICLRYGTRLTRSDPILLFTFMVLHTAVLSLCDVIEAVTWQNTEFQNAALSYKQRALSAATEIFNLSKSLAQLSCLKTHPFTPVPLMACAQFFTKHRYLDDTYDGRVQELEHLLREINLVNNLALSRNHHQRTGSGCS